MRRLALLAALALGLLACSAPPGNTGPAGSPASTGPAQTSPESTAPAQASPAGRGDY